MSAPFHCPLMRPAQQLLRADLDAAPFSGLRMPLVNNWQARLITGAGRRVRDYPAGPEPRAVGRIDAVVD